MKKLIIRTEGNLYKLAWDSGGEIPAILAGLYTSEKTAIAAGENYINSRDGVSNAKNSTREK